MLRKRGLLSKEESGEVRASVSGILFCCRKPEHFLPNAYIEAVRYRGKKQDSNYQIDVQKIRGPLNQQIEQAMTFLRKNQTFSAVKIPHRVEVQQFSERAVFEAIVNAVAHRDYSIFASKIRFFMFEDRLEIYSPGTLPNTVTIESISLTSGNPKRIDYQSYLRKRQWRKRSATWGVATTWKNEGEGVPIILDESEKLSGQNPVYRLIDDSELMLTIFSRSMKRLDEH